MKPHKHDCPQCGSRMRGHDLAFPGVCTPCMRINSDEAEKRKESTAHIRAADEISRLDSAVAKGFVTEERAAVVREYFKSFLRPAALQAAKGGDE